MKILAIDLGVSTGLVLKDTTLMSPEPIRSITVGFEHVLKELWNCNPDMIVLERMPNTLDPDLSSVISLIKNYCREYNIPIAEVAPSEWKPLAKANNWKFAAGKTRHEKDAGLMLNYFIFTGGIQRRESNVH